MKIPFSYVMPIVASSTAIQNNFASLNQPYDFHVKNFLCEVQHTIVSGKLSWNFRIYNKQDYFFYSDFPDTVWGTTIRYMPYIFQGEIVIPKNQNLEFRIVPSATFTDGQLVLNGYLNL